MKVALCLYGQPRRLYQGYENIKKNILDIFKPDVFYHTWDSKDPYDISPWHLQDSTPLDNIDKVKLLYNPISYAVEIPRKFEINTTSLGYKKSQHPNNSNNIYSQVHSRQMVRNLLFEYTKEEEKYDLVIATRFDIDDRQITNTDNTKIHFSQTHMNRPYIFDDNIVVMNQQDFLNIFNLETKLDTYLTKGPEVYEKIPLTNDTLIILGGTVINMEPLLTASIIDNNCYHKCVKDIIKN